MTSAYDEALEEAAKVVDSWLSFYPEDLFPPDGTSLDDISAKALRSVLPKIAADIRRLKGLPGAPEKS